MYKSPNFLKIGSCYACGHHKHTEWHHITPRAEGGTDERRNLIELCVSCHDIAEVEGWIWISQQYQMRHEPKRVVRGKKRPVVTLKDGEHLALDPDDLVWKVWGRDAHGIYAIAAT